MLDDLLAASADPRADHLMAIGFAMAMLEDGGEESWKLIDRDAFLSAIPEFGEEEYDETVNQSLDERDVFVYDKFFNRLNRLPSPGSAAIAVSVLYRDLMDDGESALAHGLNEQVRSRIRSYIRPN